MDKAQNSFLVRKNNGEFLVYDPNANQYSSDQNLQSAYENLEQKISQHEDTVKDFQVLSNAPQMEDNLLNRPVPLKYFLIYSLSLFLIFIMVTFKLTQGVSKQVQKVSHKIETKLLNGLSIKNLDQAKREKKLSKFKTSVEHYKPYIQTIKQAWEEETGTSNK